MRRARLFAEQLEPRRRGARDLAPRARHRLLERRRRCARSPTSGARARTRSELVQRAARDHRSRGGAARRRRARGDLPRARQDLRQRARAAVRRGRRVAQAARGRSRRLRGDGRARDDLPRRGALARSRRRQDAARRSAAGARPRRSASSSRSPRSGRRRSTTTTRRRRLSRRSSRIDPRTTRRSTRSSSCTPPPARWEPLIELYLGRLETREDDGGEERPLAPHRAVFEEKLDDKNQAFDALVNAFSEDFGDDETARYLERMAQATGRWGELIKTANAWLQEQTEPQEEDPALPAPRQVVRRGPRPPRVRAALLRSRSWRSTRTTFRSCARWRRSIAWARSGSSSARRCTRALDVAVANEDRKEILVDLGELLDKHMSQTDQGIGYYKRALEVDPLLPAGARRARAHLRRARATTRELVEILARKVQGADRRRADRGDQAAHRRRSTSRRSASSSARGKVYREVLELDAQQPAGAARPRARLRGAARTGPSSSASSSGSSTSSRPSASASRCCSSSAQIQEEHFLKSDLAAQRLEQALEIVADTRSAPTSRSSAATAGSSSGSISSTPTSATSARRPSTPTKVELYGAIAQVYADEVDDVDRAIDAYRNIVDLDDTNVPALEALAQALREAGRRRAGDRRR